MEGGRGEAGSESELEEKMSIKCSVGAEIQSLHNVFVYGSLLADEVVQVLLNRVPPSAPATLPGHHRFSIKGRVYPAILPVEDKKVNGRVLLGISGLELGILDEFEDVEYERSDVEVFLMDNSEKLQACTYIWSNKSDPNLYGDWNFEEDDSVIFKSLGTFSSLEEVQSCGSGATNFIDEWKQVHMSDFIEMTGGFMEELELPESKPRVQTYESFFKQDNDKQQDP